MSGNLHHNTNDTRKNHHPTPIAAQDKIIP